jgi:RsiW-degrading membrane proteinase PrsW (M82 family)
MTYIENIFICIATPLILTAICMGKKYYKFICFCIAGMSASLLSAYLNTFFAEYYNTDTINVITQIAPVVEEIMKLLPLLFYLFVFNPKPQKINLAVMILAVSFATFENICYLTQSSAEELYFSFIRGIGTGAMHIVCGLIVSYGLTYVWQHNWLKMAGTCGLLCAAITYHAVYNLLIAYGGVVQYFAYALPVVTILIGKITALLR